MWWGKKTCLAFGEEDEEKSTRDPHATTTTTATMNDFDD
jgi:hypothetical protein